MLGLWRRKSELTNKARALYGSIVAQARQAPFYGAMGMPDTPEGRLEMILLHLVLAAGRLGQQGAEGQALAQALNEVFITDLDDNMREMGISDVGVPRRVKKAAAGLYDRHREVLAALQAADDGQLTEVIKGYTADLKALQSLDAAALARYVRSAATSLDEHPGDQLLAGTIVFPKAG